ncbi:MAG: hypothetical protein KAI24_26655 [Planctomycetes bacterium]|nr:hypothetical protein [Planctomycetota bacterium]
MPDSPPLPPPPRPVPPSLALRIRLGGIGIMIGWLVTALGAPMAALFVGNSSLMTAHRFSGELEVGRGKVVATEYLSSRHNGSPVERVAFAFEADGRDYAGTSYTDAITPEPGATVAVEWPAGAPEHARIVGMRTAVFPGWVAFTLVFPFAGLLVVTISLVRNGRRLHLMRAGASAWGVLTAKERTSMQVNNRHVYRLTFTLLGANGEPLQATDRTHDPEFFDESVARHVLFDEATGRSCIAELLPGAPVVEDGGWQPVGPAAVLRVVSLPIVTAALFAVGLSIEL